MYIYILKHLKISIYVELSTNNSAQCLLSEGGGVRAVYCSEPHKNIVTRIELFIVIMNCY